jgi:hypothetical protein
MPGFDGTGPMGMGPMSGGGRGLCSVVAPTGSNQPPMVIHPFFGQRPFWPANVAYSLGAIHPFYLLGYGGYKGLCPGLSWGMTLRSAFFPPLLPPGNRGYGYACLRMRLGRGAWPGGGGWRGRGGRARW